MNFSHLKNQKEVQMVDISKKKSTSREARAVAIVKFSSKTFKKIVSDDSPKGSIFNTAVLAGTLAAKKTHELIPLCHNINLGSVNINFKIDKRNSSVEVNSIVKSSYKTGVEMEALTACSIACLTIYDMCKSFDKEIIINKIRLNTKVVENQVNIKMIRYTKALKLISENVIKSKALETIKTDNSNNRILGRDYYSEVNLPKIIYLQWMEL